MAKGGPSCLQDSNESDSRPLIYLKTPLHELYEWKKEDNCNKVPCSSVVVVAIVEKETASKAARKSRVRVRGQVTSERCSNTNLPP